MYFEKVLWKKSRKRKNFIINLFINILKSSRNFKSQHGWQTLLKLAYRSYSPQSYFISSIYSHSASNYELVSRVNGRRIPAGNLNKKDRISCYLRLRFSGILSLLSVLSPFCPSAVTFSAIVVSSRDLYVPGSV